MPPHPTSDCDQDESRGSGRGDMMRGDSQPREGAAGRGERDVPAARDDGRRRLPFGGSVVLWAVG